MALAMAIVAISATLPDDCDTAISQGAPRQIRCLNRHVAGATCKLDHFGDRGFRLNSLASAGLVGALSLSLPCAWAIPADTARPLSKRARSVSGSRAPPEVSSL